MLAILKQQSLERWDTLPEILREELASDSNSDLIWKTCEAESIPDKKIYGVSRIAGYVLMGFLHPEDMGAEITETLQIDRRIADSIASAINQQIFAPLKPIIDQVYAPAGSSLAPKMMNNAAQQSFASTTPVPMPKPPMPAAAPISQAGWSTRPAEPMSKPTTIPMSVARQAPMPAKMPVGSPASGATRESLAGKTFSATSAPAAQKPTMPVPPPTSAPTAAPTPTPPPVPKMIMREDAVPQPIKNAPDFHSIKSVENIMPGGKSAPMPIRPALLEMAGKPQPIPGMMNVPKPPAPRPAIASNASTDEPHTVHYGNLTSALPTQLPTGKVPVAETGRQVTEMTTATQAPEERRTGSMDPDQRPDGEKITSQAMPINAPAQQAPIAKPAIMPTTPVPPPQPKSAFATSMPPVLTPVVPTMPKPPVPAGSKPMTMTMMTKPPQLPQQTSAPAPKPLPGAMIVKNFTEEK